MKELTKKGIGHMKKQAQPITQEMESIFSGTRRSSVEILGKAC